MFGTPQLDKEEDRWRYQLAQFVKKNRQELAALSWGLFLERGKIDEVLGIDLKPKPHFVYCPKTAIEKLNENVDGFLQEILGLADAHNPEKEVLILGIGNGQVKTIFFEPDPAPPICYEQIAMDVDALLESLEQKMVQQIQP